MEENVELKAGNDEMRLSNISAQEDLKKLQNEFDQVITHNSSNDESEGFSSGHSAPKSIKLG